MTYSHIEVYKDIMSIKIRWALLGIVSLCKFITHIVLTRLSIIRQVATTGTLCQDCNTTVSTHTSSEGYQPC